MKRKIIWLILLVSLALICHIGEAKADILFDKEYGMICEKIVEHPGGNASKTCTLGFTVTDSPVSINEFKGTFSLHNVTLADKDIIMEKDWYISKDTDLTYSFSTTKTSLEVGYHKIATITFYKVVNEDECYIFYYLSNFQKINRSCSIYQGTYYDKSGNITNQTTYEDECLEKPKACSKDGDKYYDKSGSPVDQKTYQKECETNICKDFGDGTYFGKDGTEVNQQQYQEQCTEPEKHFCENVNGTYYDKEGNETTKENYEKFCFKHYCEQVYDTYFNVDGSPTSKEQYEKECFKHYCEIIDSDYYGKDGSKTTKEKYEEECTEEETHICEFVNDTYYDINGNKTTKEGYEKSCKPTIPKGPLCEVVGDKYYDDNGNEVSKEEYNKQCKKHSCEIIDDTYYDKDGNVVSKDEYTKACPLNTEENPSTGSFLPLIPLIVLITGGFGIYYWSKRNNKLV